MFERHHTNLKLACAIALAALAPVAAAGDRSIGQSLVTQVPLEYPRSLNLQLDAQARRKLALLDFDGEQYAPGLLPLRFPRNTDLRARILTPELRRTPLVGWVATSLYRSKSENGWCLVVDPGEGEYVVFYRVHL